MTSSDDDPLAPEQSVLPPQPIDPLPVLNYASPQMFGRLVTIRKYRYMEAQLAKVKLESEGIRCLILDQNMSVAHPLLFNDVPLQVLEEDAERAGQILDRPMRDDADGEYVEEDWRCPRCHRKTLDLMPLSRKWRWVRMLCWALWLAPVVLSVVRWTFELTSVAQSISRFIDWMLIPWLFSRAVLTVLVLTVKRDKRCRECGYVWQKPGKSSADIKI